MSSGWGSEFEDLNEWAHPQSPPLKPPPGLHCGPSGRATLLRWLEQNYQLKSDKINENPGVQACKIWQETQGFQDKTMKSMVDFLKTLGVPKNKIYKDLFEKYIKGKLIRKIEKSNLSQEPYENLIQRPSQMLQVLPMHPIISSLLDKIDEPPIALLTTLASDTPAAQAFYQQCSLKIKKRIWEIKPELFLKEIEPIFQSILTILHGKSTDLHRWVCSSKETQEKELIDILDSLFERIGTNKTLYTLCVYFCRTKFFLSILPAHTYTYQLPNNLKNISKDWLFVFDSISESTHTPETTINDLATHKLTFDASSTFTHSTFSLKSTEPTSHFFNKNTYTPPIQSQQQVHNFTSEPSKSNNLKGSIDTHITSATSSYKSDDDTHSIHGETTENQTYTINEHSQHPIKEEDKIPENILDDEKLEKTETFSPPSTQTSTKSRYSNDTQSTHKDLHTNNSKQKLAQNDTYTPIVCNWYYSTLRCLIAVHYKEYYSVDDIEMKQVEPWWHIIHFLEAHKKSSHLAIKHPMKRFPSILNIKSSEDLCELSFIMFNPHYLTLMIESICCSIQDTRFSSKMDQDDSKLFLYLSSIGLSAPYMCLSRYLIDYILHHSTYTHTMDTQHLTPPPAFHNPPEKVTRIRLKSIDHHTLSDTDYDSASYTPNIPYTPQTPQTPNATPLYDNTHKNTDKAIFTDHIADKINTPKRLKVSHTTQRSTDSSSSLQTSDTLPRWFTHFLVEEPKEKHTQLMDWVLYTIFNEPSAATHTFKRSIHILQRRNEPNQPHSSSIILPLVCPCITFSHFKKISRSFNYYFAASDCPDDRLIEQFTGVVESHILKQNNQIGANQLPYTRTKLLHHFAHHSAHIWYKQNKTLRDEELNLPEGLGDHVEEMKKLITQNNQALSYSYTDQSFNVNRSAEELFTKLSKYYNTDYHLNLLVLLRLICISSSSSKHILLSHLLHLLEAELEILSNDPIRTWIYEFAIKTIYYITFTSSQETSIHKNWLIPQVHTRLLENLKVDHPWTMDHVNFLKQYTR